MKPREGKVVDSMRQRFPVPSAGQWIVNGSIRQTLLLANERHVIIMVRWKRGREREREIERTKKEANK